MYRIRQFLRSLFSRVTAAERAALSRWLNVAAQALFLRMAARDQRHSLDVLRRVQAVVPDHADLAAAALLHDVAKTAGAGRRMRLHHRVLVVLLDKLSPGGSARLGSANPASLRYPFYLHRVHPELGAQMAEAAGCTPLTVALIRRHQHKLAAPPRNETERLLRILQQADDMS